MRRSALSIVLLFLATPLDGQTLRLESGAPLRVHARGLTMSGELVRWDADSLVVRPAGVIQPAGIVRSDGMGRAAELRTDRAIARSDVLRLDLEVPRTRGQGAARGALWGLVIGGAAGGFLGAITEPCDQRSFCIGPQSRAEGLLWGGALLGALGTGVGALVGTAWPGSRWEPATLDEPAETDSH